MSRLLGEATGVVKAPAQAVIDNIHRPRGRVLNPSRKQSSDYMVCRALGTCEVFIITVVENLILVSTTQPYKRMTVFIKVIT